MFSVQGKPSFIQDLVVSLPTKNETEIRQHEAWFREYEMLRERKKEAIAKWKEDKEVGHVFHVSRCWGLMLIANALF